MSLDPAIYAKASENSRNTRLSNEKLDKIMEALGIITGPAVDFIVDIFDRADSDTLGSHWGNGSGWGLRSSHAVGIENAINQVSTTLGGASAIKTGSPVAQVTLTALAKSGVVTAGSASLTNQTRYKARLSASSFKVKLKFNISSPKTIITNIATPSQVQQLATSYGQTTYAGIFAANKSSIVASTLAAAAAAGMSVSATGSGGTVTATSPAFMAGTANLTNIAGAASGNLILDTAPVNATTTTPSGTTNVVIAATTHTSLIAVGENTIIMTVNGPAVTVALNGHEIFNGMPGYVVQPQEVGIAVPSNSAITGLSAINDALTLAGLPANEIQAGITSFKAWVSAIPEPADAQSGHGLYNNGKIEWLDRYHKKEESRYVYDPLA